MFNQPVVNDKVTVSIKVRTGLFWRRWKELYAEGPAVFVEKLVEESGLTNAGKKGEKDVS